MGLFVVLPWYLAELGKVGIRWNSLLGGSWLPLLAAAVVGVAAHGIAGVTTQAFAACAASGVLALAIIGLLGYRLRSAVTALRATLREATSAGGVGGRPGGGAGQSELPSWTQGRPDLEQTTPSRDQAGPP